MALILVLDLLVVLALAASVMIRGYERTLPLAAFLLLVFPNEAQIHVPGLFDLTTQRLIILLLIVFFVLSPPTQEKRKLPLMILIPALMVWMLLSTANSVVLSVSFKNVLSEFFDFFILYYLCARTISKMETVDKILFAFVAAMFVCSIFGYFEAYRGWRVIDLFPALPSRFADISVTNDRGMRVQSTFGHPILYGATLAMALPMALYLLSITKTSGRKVFLWAAILLMFVNVYKTGSRGPWIAVILSLGLLLVFSKGKMRKALAVIFLLTATVLVARPGVLESIQNLYGATVDSDSAQGESYEWRYALYHIAVERASQNFGRALWGFGPESFAYLGWKGEFQGHIVDFDSCDSTVAALIIETGFVGFFIVAFLLGKVGVVTFQNYRKLPQPASSLCLTLFVNLCAFAFMMTNVLILGWGQQNYMLWMIIAMAMVYPGLAFSGNTMPKEEAVPSPLYAYRAAGMPKS